VIEIERKFLVAAAAMPQPERTIQIRQGYVASRDNVVCRVRQKDEQYYLSVKARIDSTSNFDFEYEIPAADGDLMLSRLCDRPPLSKRRHHVVHNDLLWEVDEFEGENAGLIIAEIELPSADYPVELPAWVGEEVTDDYRYRNSNLYLEPWSGWRG
jgi:adenylate cyclase